MDIKVIAAMITSGAALIGVVFSVIANARNQKKNTAMIEQLKFALEEEKSRQQQERERKMESRKSIDLALEFTQKIKDKLHFVLQQEHLNNNSLDWLKATHVEVMNYMDLFSTIFQKLNELERSILHDMKGQLIGLEYLLSRVIYQIQNHRPVTEYNFETRIKEIQGEITKLQEFLFVQRAIYL